MGQRVRPHSPRPTPNCLLCACSAGSICGFCEADRRNNCPCRYPGHSFGYCCTPCPACGYCDCELSCTCASHGHGTSQIGPCWGLHNHAEDMERDMRQKPDKVDHPNHYGGRDDPYEAIKVIEAWGAGFNVGNALKYIRRAGKKEEKDATPAQDYKKACWYLLRELALREGCLDPNRYTDMLGQRHAETQASTASTQTEHQQRVERMMVGFGQKVPDKPTHRDAPTRVLRARLILEEALETIQDGLRVSVSTTKAKFRSDDMEQVELDFDELHFVPKEGPVDMIELADGCADVSVVTIGTLSAFGIHDRPLLEEVDQNNLDKVNTGKVNEHGKWEKHPDHKPPRIAKILAEQADPLQNMPF